MPSKIFTLRRWLGSIPSTRCVSRSESAKTEGGIFWASSPMYTSDLMLSMTFATFFFLSLDIKIWIADFNEPKYITFILEAQIISCSITIQELNGCKFRYHKGFTMISVIKYFFFNISIQTDEGLTAIHNAEKFLCHLLFKTKTLFSHFLCWHLKITKELNLSGRSFFTVVYHISYTKRPPSCSEEGCCWGK